MFEVHSSRASIKLYAVRYYVCIGLLQTIFFIHALYLKTWVLSTCTHKSALH